MKKIGNTIILNETESPYTGKCTVDVVNRAHNIISLHRKTGEIQLYKIKRLDKLNFFRTT